MAPSVIGEMNTYPLANASARLDEFIADQRPVLLTGQQPWVLLPYSDYAHLASGAHACDHLIEAERQLRDPLPKLT